MAESYPNGQKTLWKKEKLLVTSNFSFSHCVFKRLVSQGPQKVSLCGNGLIPFQAGPDFYVSAVQFFENTVGEGEIACNENFLPFLSDLILSSANSFSLEEPSNLSFLTETINPLPERQNFRLVQIETNCRRHFKVHLK